MFIVLSGGNGAGGGRSGDAPADTLELDEPSPILARVLDEDGAVIATERLESERELLAFVAEAERGPDRPRWVWASTTDWASTLLAAGIRVERCWDLRLCGAILAASVLVPAPLRVLAADSADSADSDEVAELRRQRASLAAASEVDRLELLLAAESAGALIAAEMRFAGVPWSADEHDRILADLLGPRPPAGARPEVLARLHREVEAALGGATFNPDSPPDTLRALRLAGLQVTSTRSWELQRMEHPAIGPLLEYRALARLWTANGWGWLDRWVRNGRFRPEYVPGGVITGRWASSGGGALQLPHQVRGAVRADPDWKLVVADCAQLEPRILAAMAGDRAMTAAGAGGDLYAGLVAAGVVPERSQAKVAMLGALYGSTTGDSARLMPRLIRAYPLAIGLVEQAARDGERGLAVRTRLGRSSPSRSTAGWTGERARAWGRFTRNFIVQGTAAEWALCWLGGIRGRLTTGFPDEWPGAVPHLVFFLHDEVIVHAPEADAEAAAEAIREAADDAGRLLFGAPAGTFPLHVAVVDAYAAAK